MSSSRAFVRSLAFMLGLLPVVTCCILASDTAHPVTPAMPKHTVFNVVEFGAKEPVTGAFEQWTQVRNLRFSGFQVYNVKQLVSAPKIPSERPLQGLVLADIRGPCEQAISHAVDVALWDIDVTGFQGPLITTENVKSTGLNNAATK